MNESTSDEVFKPPLTDIYLAFTIADLYHNLLELNYTPLRSDFRSKVSDLLKLLVLKKGDISCGEQEWLKKNALFISKRISYLWKITKGNIRREHDKKFFDTVIDTSNILSHQCSKCKSGRFFNINCLLIFLKINLNHI